MKLSWLTWLRGLAALIVVYYHLNQLRDTSDMPWLTWDIYQFTEHLVFVVSFFFMTSGLFRSIPYWRSILYEWDVPAFLPALRDRVYRIAPAYYLALIASFGLIAFWREVDISDFVRLISGFAFLSWVSPTTFFPVEINGPLWFIAYDMMGWILVSWVMMGLVKIVKRYQGVVTYKNSTLEHIPTGWQRGGIFSWRILMIVCSVFLTSIAALLIFHFVWISLPWIPWSSVVGVWFPTYNPFLFGLHFLLGAIAWGIIICCQAVKSRITYDMISIVLMIGLFAFLWRIRGAEDWDYSWPHGPYHFPLVPLLVACILICLPFTRYVWLLLDNRIFLFFAKISYSLYLFHMLIIAILRKYFFYDVPLWFYNWSIFSISVLVCSIWVAWIMWKYVEQRVWIEKSR